MFALCVNGRIGLSPCPPIGRRPQITSMERDACRQLQGTEMSSLRIPAVAAEGRNGSAAWRQTTSSAVAPRARAAGVVGPCARLEIMSNRPADARPPARLLSVSLLAGSRWGSFQRTGGNPGGSTGHAPQPRAQARPLRKQLNMPTLCPAATVIICNAVGATADGATPAAFFTKAALLQLPR
ncbi:hypothetical protein ANO11243_079020 [Dothideomycetidae sp. 11243]|nr:hypothetical protein ANO11243_079020 [fungal sp. No.11243]